MAVDAIARDVGEVFPPDFVPADHWVWRITFTPDGRTAYFAASEGWFPRTRSATILRTTRGSDGRWTTPDTATFSGIHSDMDPFITPDGRRLYFSSSRPLDGRERDVFDLWYVDRTEDGDWSDPIRLGDEVNSDLDELYASADAAGTLYFARGPTRPSPDVAWNLYRAEPRDGGFAPGRPLDGVNNDRLIDPDDPTATWDFNPEISPDGTTLFFTSLRASGHGFGDLHVAIRNGDGWSEPRNLGPPVSTGDDEYHPTLSPDGRTLYFIRARVGPEVAPGRFLSIPVSALDLPPSLASGSRR